MTPIRASMVGPPLLSATRIKAYIAVPKKVALCRSCPSRKRLSHPIQRRMTAVLHLDPTRRPPAAVNAIPTLGDHTLKAKLASLAKQVRSDLALFKRRDEDAVRPTCQKPGEIGLAQMQRQLAQVFAFQRQDVGGIEAYFVIM